MSIAAFVTQLGLLNILRYNQTICILSNTIRKTAGQLAAFGLFTAAFIMAFAGLTHCLFGPQLYEFRSIVSTYGRLLIRHMHLDYALVDEAAGPGGVLIMLIFCFTMLIILLNFVITFINDALSELANNKGILLKDHEVIDYLVSMLFGRLFTPKDDTNGTGN